MKILLLLNFLSRLFPLVAFIWEFYVFNEQYFYTQTEFLCGKRGGLMVSALDSGASGSSSSPGKPSRKAPETTFGCFSKHPKNFEPEKYVIFARKLHGYSLPPEKRLSYLLNKMASADILFRAK